MILDAYLFHLRARNLSPATIKATEEFLRPFIRTCEPLSATRNDIETFLGNLYLTCAPSTVWTYWRHIGGLFKWLESEGDRDDNPMASIPRPLVPPSEVRTLSPDEVRALLRACEGKRSDDRRDLAIIAIMLDSGVRLGELQRMGREDIGEDGTIRVFGKGRKWRTIALGSAASAALYRWLRTRGEASGPLWTGRKGPLTPNGVRRIVVTRGKSAGLDLHPHMLRHTFVDNWLRNGGAEVDLARLAGWTTTRMAERYARHQANERAVKAHSNVGPLDNLLVNDSHSRKQHQNN